MALLTQAHAEREVASLKNTLALTFLKMGQVSRAAELAGEAHADALRGRDELLRAYVYETQAEIALVEGDLDRALELAGLAAKQAAERGAPTVAASEPVVDCAAMSLGVPDHTDVLSYPVSMSSATDDVVRRLSIGTGDEVFMTGLFVHHYGSDRNIPIIRTGNIAAMPSEPVKTARGPMDAFLVEARPLGDLAVPRSSCSFPLHSLS